MYWSHCGDARARLRGHRDAEARLLRRGSRRWVARSSSAGYSAFKTNVVVPGDEPGAHAGFNEGGGRSGRGDRRRARPTARARSRRDQGNARPSSTSTSTSSPRVRARREGARAVRPALARSRPLRPGALAHVRHVAPMPVCSGENLYGSRDFRPYLEAAASTSPRSTSSGTASTRRRRSPILRDVRGELRAAQLLLAPRDVHRAQWCAAIPNARILEYDVDDVPWRDELVTALPEISAASYVFPGPGLGCRAERDVLAAAPLASLGSPVPVGRQCAEAAPDKREPSVAATQLQPGELRELVPAA